MQTLWNSVYDQRLIILFILRKEEESPFERAVFDKAFLSQEGRQFFVNVIISCSLCLTSTPCRHALTLPTTKWYRHFCTFPVEHKQFFSFSFAVTF